MLTLGFAGGAGGALLEAEEGWLQRLGARDTRVRGPDGHPSLLAFFEKRRYILDRVGVGFYGHRRDAILFAKSLAGDRTLRGSSIRLTGGRREEKENGRV